MSIYYSDDSLTLHQGDALAVLSTMESGSVDCVVTSPPYFGLRDYGEPGQIGLEETPAEYIAKLVAVFVEVRRVLATTGTCWLNLGDSYATHQKGDGGSDRSTLSGRLDLKRPLWSFPSDRPQKNLLGLPWRTALALQDAGWILRNDIVWAKPNAMPESVTDRLSSRHEHLFLLVKSRRYHFDLNAIREPVTRPQRPRPQNGHNKTPAHAAATDNTGWKDHAVSPHEHGRNPGDVWTIPTTPYSSAHFATFPPKLPRLCILAGCTPGGRVLDLFAGSGTTLMVAQRLGRRAVGIDLSAQYCAMALQRCAGAPLWFGGGAA